jgi:phosphohistidine swiveling domain-containing protein
MQGADERIADYLEQPGEDLSIRWSRVNAAEQYPGQVSPLAWSYQLQFGDRTMRRVFHRMGLLAKTELASPAAVGDQFVAMRHGRLCANVDVMRDAMDRLPGEAGDAVEEHLLGAKPSGPQKRSRKRPLAVALHMPPALFVSIRHSPAAAAATKRWWQDWIRRIDREGASAARIALGEVTPRQAADAEIFGVAAFCQQAIHGALAEMLPAERRHLLLQIPSGQVFPEGQFAVALWEHANGKRSREDVVEAYGYFGSDGGDCASPSIRATPAMLDGLTGVYRDTPSPAAMIGASQARRAALVQEMLAGTGGWRLRVTRWLLGMSDRLALARELGRSAWLQSMDVGRCAATAVGRELAATGRLRSEADAMYLTWQELLEADPAGFDATVAYRRALESWRDTFTLPNGFAGDPELIPVASHQAAGDEEDSGEPLAGMPAAAGIVRATARVVMSPFEARGFQKGDILVCRFTDPSWTPIISLAGGIVADIGGSLSHGAIIARELGVPAVVNTRVGTRRIRDGSVIEINGGTGEITVISEPAPQEAAA